MTAIALAELAAPRTRLRITRRGRAVLAGVVAAPFVVAVFTSVLGGAAATATSTVIDAPPTVVTVEAGQSLWQIAAIVAPEANPADVVADLIAHNALESGSVLPGQTLVLPERYAD